MRKFAVFILTHGRADNVLTYETLRSGGYTGPVYFIIDNLDEQAEKYRQNFGAENVIVFDKPASVAEVDTMDNLQGMNVVVFARNQCHKIAESLGLTHFLELDDDYDVFCFRWVENGLLKQRTCRTLDALFSNVLDCLDVTGASTIALSQNGDFIGGAGSSFYYKRVARKAMNSFFCRTDRPFRFMGRINEDTNAYTFLGSQGLLFFTITEASLHQTETQQSDGGLTEVYLDLGTYVKSFYTVMLCPSCAKIATMGNRFRRVHHAISWGHAVPCILSEGWKK